MLHISGINYESIADAEGVACTIFFSGCKHYCKGCHSPDTWDFNNGVPVSDELISTINQELDKRPFLSALVLSGGDPMYSAGEVVDFVRQLHVPHNNIWCFTGFLFEEIIEDPLMCDLRDMCSHIIDGPFDIAQRDVTLRFRGSANQRHFQKQPNGRWLLVD